MNAREGNVASAATSSTSKETAPMNARDRIPARHLCAAAALATVVALFLAASTSAAVPPAPSWTIASVATPTNFVRGDVVNDYSYEVTITNSGGGATDGSPVTIVDKLPKHLTVLKSEFKLRYKGTSQDLGESGSNPEHIQICEKQETAAEAWTVTCTIPHEFAGTGEAVSLFTPGEVAHLVVHVSIPMSATVEGEALINEAEVQGGGAAPVSTSSKNVVSSQPAPPGLAYFQAALTGPDGQPATQAASHPYQYTTSFSLNTKETPPGTETRIVPSGGDAKDLPVALPQGLIGSPTSTTRCTAQQFSSTHLLAFPPELNPYGANVIDQQNECPDGAAVGFVVLLRVESFAGINVVPLYNLVPPPGEPAQLGFQFASVPFFIDTEVRPDENYKIVGALHNNNQAKRVISASVTLWGTPAAKAHDAIRGGCLNPAAEVLPWSIGECPAGITPRPFLRLPTSCVNPLATVMSVDTWSAPGAFFSSTSTSPAPTGCNLLTFEPSLEAHPTASVADSPTGLRADLHVPQNETPEGLGEADLRKTVVDLPEGLVLNPASANGLGSCSSAQIGREEGSQSGFDNEPAHCPDSAKIGTVEVDTPLIDHPLPGSVYVATPYDNPFHSLLAIYVVVHDPATGIVVKLAGKVEADSSTGRLTTTFDETPQTPFEDFKLNFFSGPGAPLRTPSTCGTYSTASTMTPWSAPESGPPAGDSDTYAISKAPSGSSCPASKSALPHAPSFSAGTISPIAGAYSPFVVNLRREDGSQEFASLTVTPPPGLLGRLAGIPYCPDSALAQAAAKSGTAEKAHPSCPAASEVGTVTVGAGAGAAPYYTQGRAYLAGPYKGAPLSLAIVTPATAGPYDIGTVVVRTALYVDPETAQISAKSDPIPHILEGIPLDVRSIAVRLDRPSFTLNPTNCDPFAVGGALVSTLGQSASLTDHFQVSECAALGFKPSLSLHLKGGIARSSHPALRAVLTYPKGAYANVARASVALPHSEFLDQGHIRTVCTRVQFAANACPAGAIYGYARAITPLLDAPLEGPVYLRSSSNPLPDLVADLNGQIHVVLDGRIDSVHGGIRTTFAVVPDAPVSKFVLEMQGGKKGLLVNSRNICAGVNRATAKFKAQDGDAYDSKPPLKAQCAKRAKHRKR